VTCMGTTRLGNMEMSVRIDKMRFLVSSLQRDVVICTDASVNKMS